MSRKHFGTDGVRGTVGQSPMTPDFVLRLGYAAGRVLLRSAATGGRAPAVLIGKDTRISGYMVEAALEAGFSAAGVDVLLCGPLPTPGGRLPHARAAPVGGRGDQRLAQSLRRQRHQVLLRATASSCPTRSRRRSSARSSSRSAATSRRSSAARAASTTRGGRYIEFCKTTFPNELDLKGMKIVVDCAHGAAYHVAPHVFHELGADVMAIGVAPDGFNINDKFGATATGNLAMEVKRTRRTSASRSTATPTGWWSWTAGAASTTATSCSTSSCGTAPPGTRSPASPAR